MAKREHKHQAWTLLEEFAAVAKDYAADPAAFTPAQGLKASQLEQKIYELAPSAPEKEGGEILMAIADIAKQTGIYNRKGKHRRAEPSV